MSIECGECERDARAGHDHKCSRFRKSFELQMIPDEDDFNLHIVDKTYVLERKSIQIPESQIDLLIEDLLALQQSRSGDAKTFMHPVKRPYAIALVALEQAADAAGKIYLWMTSLPKKHQDTFPSGSLAVTVDAAKMIKNAPKDVAKLSKRLASKKTGKLALRVDGPKRKV